MTIDKELLFFEKLKDLVAHCQDDFSLDALNLARTVFGLEFCLVDASGEVVLKSDAMEYDSGLFLEFEAEVSPKYNVKYCGKVLCILPFLVGMRKYGILFFQSHDFLEPPYVRAVSVSGTIISIFCDRSQKEQVAQKNVRTSVVRRSLGTLSYSEMFAMIYIFDGVYEKNLIINATRISKDKNITKSAIVNGLRKLESAGIIEAQSLGVKGTSIAIKNQSLLLELEKMKKLN